MMKKFIMSITTFSMIFSFSLFTVHNANTQNDQGKPFIQIEIKAFHDNPGH